MTFIKDLYPFQVEAKDKMVDRGQVLVAMTMGAGKTAVTLATIEELHDAGEVDWCLLVVPSSLKYQWASEIEKFTDANYVVIDGPPKVREAQWRKSRSVRYTIINAELLGNDLDYVNKSEFQAMVVDEATIIKSPSAARSKVVKRLGKRCHYRYALTGQPIENRPEELFSIMQFVDPNVLGKFTEFDRTFIVRDYFGKPQRYRNLDVLHKSLQNVMVRKTREDIQDQLPQVINKVVPVPFDKPGFDTYQRIAHDLLVTIQEAIQTHGRSFDLWKHYNGGGGDEAQGAIMAKLTVLRMLCDNPDLVRLSAQAYDDPTNKGGSAYAAEIVSAGWLTSKSAPKLDAVIDYIRTILDEDPKNKVVLFSFFKANLRLIQQAMEPYTNSVLFMGGMNAAERQVAKTQFQIDPRCRLFLSSDAGGYGVDLPMANHLISYDLPWSAGKLDQREARIIRLSSEFPHITLTSFVMANSIEERQWHMLQQKRDIGSAFLDGKHDSTGGLELSLQSLTSFLQGTT